MIDTLVTLDAMEQAALVKRGEVSALELVDAAIARIEALEPKVHALAATDFEAARKRAAAQPQGPLGGVPFLVKDLIAYPGLRCAMGSRLFAQNVPVDHTPYSQALDAAGLVVLGKTTTSELGLLGSTETLLEGVTRNPWDPARSAGGSSGGSAAAVACRMVPFAHASDGGGSIRIPAAMNGLFGFKPGSGRALPAAPADMHGLVIEHCVSWSVRDSALLYSLTSPGQPFVREPDRRRLRIGWYTETLVGQRPAPPVREAFEATLGVCRELGHELVQVEGPPIDGHQVGDAFFTLAGAFLEQLDQMMTPMLGRALGSAELEPFTLAVLAWYRGLEAGATARALETCERAERIVADWIQGCDVMLCPTIPVEVYELGTLAPTLDRETIMARMEQLAGYTPVHNLAKVPAMTVPLHVSADGLPVGSHFAAKRGDEATLFALAYELEAAAPWRDRWPAPARLSNL